jgi:hypothetical protein
MPGGGRITADPIQPWRLEYESDVEDTLALIRNQPLESLERSESGISFNALVGSIFKRLRHLTNLGDTGQNAAWKTAVPQPWKCCRR